MTVEDIRNKINSISVDISDSNIKLIPFPASYQYTPFQNSQVVYLFDSTVKQTVPIVELTLNTDTDLTNKNITLTIHFKN